MSVQIDGDAVTNVTDLRFQSGSAPYGTAPVGTGIVTVAAGVVRHQIHRVKVTVAACTAAATTQDFTLWTTPAKTRVVRVICKVLTNFTGGSVTAATITCGSSAGGNQYLLSNSVFSGTPVLGDVVAEMGAGVVSSTLADYSDAGVTIQSRLTTTTANVNALTAGEMDYYIETITYP